MLRLAVILSTPLVLALGGWYLFAAVFLYLLGEVLDRRMAAARLQPVVEPVQISRPPVN